MRALLSLFLLCLFHLGYSQTCCSGGVPLSSNLGLPLEEAQVLQLNLSYDLNVLNRLLQGADRLDDQARNRSTHSILFQAGYSINDQFAIDAFFSFVRQEREINQFASSDFDVTQGIGDAALLFKYTVLSLPQHATSLTIGAGPKFPLGSSTERDANGLALNADLQPGSGAWDGIFWGQLIHNANFRPSMSLALTSIFSLKGENDNYLPFFDQVQQRTISQTYQFGNDLQIMFGIGDRFLLGNMLLDPSLTFRYRKTQQDIFNEERLPSTGGEWLFINPGISYWLSEQISLNTGAEFPLYDFVIGTQVTPAFRLNVGIYYQLSFAKSQSLNRISHEN